MERQVKSMNKPTYQQLVQLYEDSLDTICSQQMEIKELMQERDDYIQGYFELQDLLTTHNLL